VKHAFAQLALAIKNLVGGLLVPQQLTDFNALSLAGSAETYRRLAIETW